VYRDLLFVRGLGLRDVPYWQLGFADITLRLLGSGDFPPAVKAGAARELTAALIDGSLRSTIAGRVLIELKDL
jgi:NADPH:quinone reductase